MILIHKIVKKCRNCPARLEAREPVPGTGPIETRVMIIGRNPGDHEDRQGVPFIGRAGQLLNKLIKIMGLKREDIYITNLVKCHTVGNRPPTPSEIDACAPHLAAEMKTIKPKLIITLGNEATAKVIGGEVRSNRQKILDGSFDGGRSAVKIVCLYHPSYGLRSVDGRKKLEEDAVWVHDKLLELGLISPDEDGMVLEEILNGEIL